MITFSGDWREDLPPHHMPIDTAKVLTRLPMRMITFPIIMHHRRPNFVDIISPMKAVTIDGRKKDAA